MEDAGTAHPVHSRIQRDLVLVGASAGGVEALQTLVGSLPAEFPAAILVVLHVPSSGASVLPQILSRKGRLPASFARDGDRITRGQIYVAPADHHMLVHDGTIRLTQGPRENGHRPAIDPLFRSAARAAGRRTIGVVLSGLLDDGATGLAFVKSHGGTAVVQSPEDADFPSMPQAAIAATRVDVIANAADLADAICELIDRPLSMEEIEHRPDAPLGRLEAGLDRVEIEDPSETAELLSGPPSALTCPECGGALWEEQRAGTARFTCHVGHSFTLASLVEEQGRDLETTLWSAVRSLEERADVHRRLARRSGGSRADAYEDRAREAEEHARKLREILSGVGRLVAETPEQA